MAEKKRDQWEFNLIKETFKRKIPIFIKSLGKEEIIVNSSHHQAIKRLGKNLKVSAKFIDNGLEIIEGIEHENYP